MNFGDFYKNTDYNEIINNREINEGLSFMNSLYKITGSQKRTINPSKYRSYVVGSTGYSNLLDRFSDSVIKIQGGKAPKTKIFVKDIYQGIPPNVNKLQRMNVKTAVGGMFDKMETINFWEPVEKINHVSLYVTNSGMLGSDGEIVLWDVQTKSDFDDIENAQELEELGWKEGENQFILSVNGRGYKYWTQITGMTIEAWVKKSRIGNVSDPYFSIKDDISKKNQKPKVSQAVISKDLFSKLIPNTNESYVMEAEKKKSKRKVVYDKENNIWKRYSEKQKSIKQMAGIRPDELRSTDIAVDMKGEPDEDLQNKLDNIVDSKNTSSEEPKQSDSNDDQTIEEPQETPPKENLVMKHLQSKIKNFDKIQTTSTDLTDKGWVYNFINGGKLFVYTLKDAPEDNKYKVAWDEKAKRIISNIPELKKQLTRVDAVE